MAAREAGVIYFKLADRYDSGNTTYGNDITKNCGLSGTEIDKNFHFLRGSDIEAGTWSPETKTLVLKRVNGELIKIEGTNFSQAISFSGSTFSPESGGTLTLVANGGEPYQITGFTEACADIIETLSGISENDELLASLNEDFLALSEYVHTEFEQFYIFEHGIAEDLARINRDFDAEICEIKRKLENEILTRGREDRTLNEKIAALKDDYKTTLQNFTIGYTQTIDEFNNRLSGLENRVSDIESSISEIKETACQDKNDLEEALRIEKEERMRNDRELGTKIGREVTERKAAVNALKQDINNLESSVTDRVTDAINHNNSEIERIETRVSENASNIAELDSSLSTEKSKRQAEDRRITETITAKESALRELIAAEQRIRTNAVNNLEQEIANETSQRNAAITGVQSSLRTLQNTVNNETQTRNTELNKQRREIERLINSEAQERRRADADILRGINNNLIGVGEDIERLKDYVKWLYIDDRSLPHDSCDEILWGIVIQDVQDEEGQTRKRIVLNLDPNDKFLSQSCNQLSSTISLKFNEDNKHIELRGRNGAVVSYVDADAFIQKGFLKNAGVEEVSGETALVLTWDNGTDNPPRTVIPVADLFKAYEAGNGIDIDSANIISVTIGEGEQYLDFRNGKLVTIGIGDAINDAIEAYDANIRTVILTQINTLSDNIDVKLDEIRDSLADIESKKLDITEFESYTANTQSTITNITQQIENLDERIDNIASGDDLRELSERMHGLESSLTQTNTTVNNMSQDISENRDDINALLGLEKQGEILEQPSLNVIMVTDKGGAGAYEVGTTLHIDTAGFVLNGGRYTYGPEETGVVQQGDATTGFTQSVLNRSLTVNDNTNLQFRVTLTYSNGVKPYTNLGREGTNNGIQSNTITGYSAAITGFRYNFFTAKNEITQSSGFSNSFIRGLNKTSESTFNIQIESGNKEVIIAIPSGKTLTSVLDTNFNNQDIKGNFQMATCQVSGKITSANMMTYKVYYYIPDAPFTVNNIYKVTIG